jgi:hypothetical protein
MKINLNWNLFPFSVEVDAVPLDRIAMKIFQESNQDEDSIVQETGQKNIYTKEGECNCNNAMQPDRIIGCSQKEQSPSSIELNGLFMLLEDNNVPLINCEKT